MFGLGRSLDPTPAPQAVSKEHMVEFEFYPEPFDITKPPPVPPCREMTHWLVVGFVETKKSKRRGLEWDFRISEYGQRLRDKKDSAV